MGRAIAIAWLSFSFVGLVLGGLNLKDALSAPKAAILLPTEFEIQEATVAPKLAERRFAPIFGISDETPVAVATSVRLDPEIKLLGTMILGETRHAFLETPEGQIAVREGEQLDGPVEVKRIKDSQIDILFDGRIVSIDIGNLDTSSRRIAKLRQQSPDMQPTYEAKVAMPMRNSYRMSREEVLALLRDPRAHPTAFASQ